MISLIFTSTSKDSLSLYVKFIKLVFKNLSVKSSASGMLAKKKRLVLLKSPHVYKKSKEHFEITKFRSTFCIKNDANFDLSVLKYFLHNKPKSVTLKIIKTEV